MDYHQLAYYLEGDGYPGSHFSEPVWQIILSDPMAGSRHLVRFQLLFELWCAADHRNKSMLTQQMPSGFEAIMRAYRDGELERNAAIDALHHVLDVLPYILYDAYPQLRQAIRAYGALNDGAIRALTQKED